VVKTWVEERSWKKIEKLGKTGKEERKSGGAEFCKISYVYVFFIRLIIF
jgi:hypothetical protein